MNCLITAGPTYEPLDQVRRLTNMSTGRLGCELANHLAQHGHHVTLLVGEQATWSGPCCVQRVQRFGTTASLRTRLQALAEESFDGVFHAAAVSDFAFGRVWSRSPAGELTELASGKISTGHPSLLAELKPTPKIIAELREWFPQARLVGWKYEVDGDQPSALAKARRQIEEHRTDACVANGPAYGSGFGFVQRDARVLHVPNRPALYLELEQWLRR